MATSQTYNGARMYNPEKESVEEFLQRFQVQNFRELEDADATPKLRAMFLANALPTEIVTDIQQRLKPIVLTDATYDQIKQQLTSAYSVKKSLIGASVQFLTRKQRAHESIEVYSKVLNELASHCDYPSASRDRLLRDAFVCGLNSHKLIQSLIAECENKSFQESVDRAKILLQFSQDADDIHPSGTAFVHASNRVARASTGSSGNDASTEVPENYTCIRCGTKSKHFAHQCFALKKKCLKCQKMGHIARACKGKKVEETTPANYVHVGSHVHAEEEDPTDYVSINILNKTESSSDEESISLPPVPLPVRIFLLIS